MKKLLTILAIFAIAVTSVNAVQKRALIEFATGAWCGYCPTASVEIEKLEGKFGDNVVCLKYHSSDAMQPPQTGILSIIGQGYSGVPAVMCDRQIINYGDTKSWAGNAGYASYIAPQLIGDNALADIQCIFEKQSGSKTVKGKVRVEFLEDLPYPLGFTVVVAEDKVTGTGQGYDQKNYFSGDASHPWGNKPKVVKGYEHNNTVRLVIGDPWGLPGDLPKTGVSAGEVYTYDFTAVVPSPADGSSINFKNIRVAAILNLCAKGKIPTLVNCCWATEGNPDDLGGGSGSEPDITGVADNDLIQIIPATKAGRFEFTLTNNGDKTKSVNITFEKIYAPEGWTASLNDGAKSVNVIKGLTATLDLVVKPNGAKGTAIYKVIATDGKNEPIEWITKTTNKASTHAVVYGDEEGSDFLSFLADTDYPECAYIGIKDFANSKKFTDFMDDMVKLQYCMVSMGETSPLPNNYANILSGWLDDGCNLVLTGNKFFAESNNKTITKFANKLGFIIEKDPYEDVNDDWEMPYIGIEGDPYFGELSGSIIPGESYPVVYTIYNAGIAKPALEFKDAPGTYFAVRSKTEKFKALTISASFNQIDTDKNKLALFNTAFYYLENDIQEKEAKISCDITEFDFGKKEVGTTAIESITIGNTGEAILTFSDVKVEGDAFGHVLTGDLPSIAPGAEVDLDFAFKPSKDAEYIGKITIKTNGGTKEIKLMGTGVTSSVNDIKNVFTFSATPNPIETVTTINFNVLGTARNIEMNIIDLNGKHIASIVNGIYTQGSHTIDYNASNLAAGSYYITAKIDDQSAVLPIIVK